MAITINSNMLSLRTQRSVADSGKELGRVFEQLSSGQRINRASDDSAGLAIADSLNAKSRIFTQGIRNVNDGISLVSIADSAIGSLTDITGRLKELAEQSANGVYNSKQRKALDDEAQALSKEFTRIVKTTSFNGLNLFDGSVQGLRIQAGTGVDGSIFSSLGGSIGTGTFGPTSTIMTGVNEQQSLVASDLNGDGILDLVMRDRSTPVVILMMGKGDGTFAPQTTLVADSTAGGATTADINGDGILDIVSGDYFSNSIAIYIGKGDGTFASRKTFQTSSGTFTPTVADVNNDGFLDLLTGADVLLGTGDGNFKPKITAPNGGFIIGDINGDGFLDTAGGVYSGSRDIIYLGKGDGTFTVSQTLATGFNPVGLASGDLNGDGFLDLVDIDSWGGTAGVFLGNGNGTFQARQAITTAVNPRALQLADINGDGKLDIITSEPTVNTSSIFLGNGDGTFAARTTIQGGFYALSIADLNRDGVLDISTTDSVTKALSIHLGIGKDGINPILNFSLTSAASSRQALSLFDTKQNLLTSQRGILGAFQSRLDTATNLLSNESENFKAAESRIRDVDVASASAELTRLNILQQAGISVLSQANLQPQIALTLLKM